MTGKRGLNSGYGTGADAHGKLVRDPGGRPYTCCMLQMDVHQERHPSSQKCTLLRKYLNDNVETEQGHMLFHVQNSLVMNKGLLYVSTMLKGEKEGVLAFVVPAAQCCAAFNGVHCDAGHQGQQRTLALTQEHFWWPLMADNCQP